MGNTDRMPLIVGIPAYNEQETIAEIVQRCRAYADAVVVVDDGSTDLTAFRAHDAGATVLRHRQNSGKGAAVTSLFAYAIRHQADVLVLIDADGQHDPDEIPLVAEPCLRDHADIVVGSRFLPGSASATPRVRRLGQVAFNTMTTLASGVRCSDSQSGFRAFNRRAFCAMRLSEPSFAVETEIQFECRIRKLRLAEVPISCDYDLPPKRNVFGHGFSVLKRLTSMAIQRRALGHTPVPHVPTAHHPLMPGNASFERSAHEVATAARGD